jgi:hypothetical protein
MPYVKRPFAPLNPTPNQVITELHQANENFDILARAFVDENPETRTVLNSFRLQGYLPSFIPSPFRIPVADASGKIHPSWLPDDFGFSGSGSGDSGSEYGFRRVDLTNAVSDYDLQVGEEAYYVWDISVSRVRPLRIRVSGSFYQLMIVGSLNLFKDISYPDSIHLVPNNVLDYGYIASSSMFLDLLDWSTMVRVSGSAWHPFDNRFRFNFSGLLIAWIQNGALFKTVFSLSSDTYKRHLGEVIYPLIAPVVSAQLWVNYDYETGSFFPITWNSLGTLIFGENGAPTQSGILYILVRRLA